MEYVIRQIEGNTINYMEVDDPDLDNIDTALNTRLAGNFYKDDNAKVYQLLQGFLVGTPGYNYIHNLARTKNGRGAWLSLRAHYEGDSFKGAL